MGYFTDINAGIRTTLTGLKLTFRHLRQATHRRAAMGVASANYFDQQTGLVTLQYPHEQLPIPDNGRYRLHNEMDDCIVCDKCAKICPVDCITIDPIKATGEVGRASDGSPIRLYAAKFDIDMAKCCYCGLCTVVCPTECLTMEKKFDYSEFDLGKLTYHFGNLSPDEAEEKRVLYEQFVREKEELKAQQLATKPVATPAATSTSAPKRPLFKPAPPKPAAPAEATPTEAEQIATGAVAERSDSNLVDNTTPIEPPVAETPPPLRKPAFRPIMKPTMPKPPANSGNETDKPA